MEKDLSQEYISPYAEDLDKILNNNPQKELFWNHFLSVSSPGFGNTTKAALLSGFTEQEAKSVSKQRWFKYGMKRQNMGDQAEEVLHEMLVLPKNKIKIVNGEECVVEDPALLKISQDTAKYITSTLLKDVYATKVENKNETNTTIKIKNEISDDEFDKIMTNYAKRKSIDQKGDTIESLPE